MTNACFFLPGDCEERYRRCRDSEHADERAEIQRLWERFSPVLGDDPNHFLRDARVNFVQRLWEMRLACVLMDRGYHLECPPADGPDIRLRTANLLWIEATAPRRGDGPDAVPEPPIDLPHLVDRKGMAMRYVSAIEAKAKQRDAFLRRQVIDESEPFAIALNTCLIPDSRFEPHGMPDVVLALLGRDQAQYQFAFNAEQGAHGKPRREYPVLGGVTKSSGSIVPLGAFNSERLAGVSAVVFCARDPIQIDARDLGILHNPFAANPLAVGQLSFAREFWVEGDRLRCSRRVVGL